MDIDYKLNYLSKTFSKIDRKGIETYVIARIWNKLDNLDIKILLNIDVLERYQMASSKLVVR